MGVALGVVVTVNVLVGVAVVVDVGVTVIVAVAVLVGVALEVGVGVAGSTTVNDSGWFGQSTTGQPVPSICNWKRMTSPA